MHRDVMFEKTRKLAESGRVEALGNGVFNVIGDHGTYTVAVDFAGKISCNCPGFLSKGKCSHAGAVNILMRRRQPRNPGNL